MMVGSVTFDQLASEIEIREEMIESLAKDISRSASKAGGSVDQVNDLGLPSNVSALQYHCRTRLHRYK